MSELSDKMKRAHDQQRVPNNSEEDKRKLREIADEIIAQRDSSQ